MRESGLERERWLARVAFQTVTPALLFAGCVVFWGERGPSRVPPKGRDGDDLLDARPRRRKALRQVDRGQDWQREQAAQGLG